MNHVGLCTEEISDAGEAYVLGSSYMETSLISTYARLGNAVQGFTYVLLPSVILSSLRAQKPTQARHSHLRSV